MINDVIWYLTFSSLVVFLNISFGIYANTKDRIFLKYGLYNLFVIIYLILQNGNIIDFNSTPELKRVSNVIWYIQIIYYSLISLFAIDFLDFKTRFPLFAKYFTYYAISAPILGCILYFYVTIWHIKGVYTNAYLLVYVPIQIIFSISFIVLSFNKKSKKYRFFRLGMAFFLLLSICAYIFNFIEAEIFKNFDTVNFFYIGLIVEGTFYAYGLGIRIKEMYQEKLIYQTELTKAQEELKINFQNKLATTIEQNKQLALQKQMSELNYTVMNAQMNSHFLFNALNAIKAYIISSDTKNAVNYLNKFSKFIRKILDVNRGDLHTLEDEITSIANYLNIEQLRLKNSFHFDINTNTSHLNIPFPHLLLQPFIENSIWHGLMHSEGDKRITINIYDEERTVVIEVKDNGIGLQKSMSRQKSTNINHKSYGLKIIDDRVKQYNSEERFYINYTLDDLQEANQTGAVAKVVITPNNNLHD